jgi:hypothetical protein
MGISRFACRLNLQWAFFADHLEARKHRGVQARLRVARGLAYLCRNCSD